MISLLQDLAQVPDDEEEADVGGHDGTEVARMPARPTLNY